MTKNELFQRLWRDVKQDPPESQGRNVLAWDGENGKPFTILDRHLRKMQIQKVEGTYRNESHPGYRATHWMQIIGPKER